MVNTSSYHRSNIEKVLLLEDGIVPEIVLHDIRIHIFLILADNPSKSYTLDELLKQIRAETNIDQSLLENKGKVNILLNIMYSYELITHDFKTKTFKYKDSVTSSLLKENIEKIKLQYKPI